MKIPTVFLLSLGACLPSHGQDATSPILGGTPSALVETPARPAFEVQRELAQRIVVTRKGAGAPVITGTVNAKVQVVADPGLPAPLMTKTAGDDAAGQQHSPEAPDSEEEYRETKFVYLSATVIDHASTELRVWLPGAPEVRAVSNVDFNHFSGVGDYQVKEADGTLTPYSLLMGLGNSTAPRKAKRPAPPAEGPGYVLLDADPTGEAARLLDGLHALYRTEGARMAEAYAQREQARKEREAQERQQPPAPQEVTLRFWKKEPPAGLN